MARRDEHEDEVTPDERVLHVGVDGAKGRWIAVGLDGAGAFLTARLVDTVAGVLEAFPAALAFGVDVPIGLTDTAGRPADIAAKKLLGSRSSTVFTVPPRAALEASTYEAARKTAVAITGKSLSAQSYALRHNILEVDALLANAAPEVAARVFEVHPEVSFRALGGHVLTSNKRTWNGASERRRLLAEAGIVLPDDLGRAGEVALDDVLDAGAAAWSARRIARGEARRVPEEPEKDHSAGAARAIAIWY